MQSKKGEGANIIRIDTLALRKRYACVPLFSVGLTTFRTAIQGLSSKPAEPTRTASQLPKVEGRLAFDFSTTNNADLYDLLEP